MNGLESDIHKFLFGLALFEFGDGKESEIMGIFLVLDSLVGFTDNDIFSGVIEQYMNNIVKEQFDSVLED